MEPSDQGDTSAAAQAWDEARQRAYRGTSLAELRAIPEDELVRRYDALVAPPPHEHLWPVMEAEDYRRELDRRAAKAQADRIERLTWVMAALTLASVLAAVAAIVVAAQAG